ncbi:hypothetical protein SeMB42_g03253 [Synchytrium endobioticum]|uniref:SprT-like domain-containing protein n=1 Tax=Synchytrium endobioticum TaxID=286115 RepID=A0A507CVW5_9FUNG|nr:hypothetical protein SeLEV6574_g05286 [Synchytrium endobioticum]TPX47611.1 hypothetical protein SeMB42_g03253 [Synchytrium endobioticum]
MLAGNDHPSDPMIEARLIPSSLLPSINGQLRRRKLPNYNTSQISNDDADIEQKEQCITSFQISGEPNTIAQATLAACESVGTPTGDLAYAAQDDRMQNNSFHHDGQYLPGDTYTTDTAADGGKNGVLTSPVEDTDQGRSGSDPCPSSIHDGVPYPVESQAGLQANNESDIRPVHKGMEAQSTVDEESPIVRRRRPFANGRSVRRAILSSDESESESYSGDVTAGSHDSAVIKQQCKSARSVLPPDATFPSICTWREASSTYFSSDDANDIQLTSVKLPNPDTARARLPLVVIDLSSDEDALPRRRNNRKAKTLRRVVESDSSDSDAAHNHSLGTPRGQCRKGTGVELDTSRPVEGEFKKKTIEQAPSNRNFGGLDSPYLVYERTPSRPARETPQTHLRTWSPESLPPTPSVRFTRQAPTAKRFKQERHTLTLAIYAEFNKKVFRDRLPADLSITWGNTLNKTAGRTFTTSETIHERTSRSARVELSCKVLDTQWRLRNTLAHELCHVAAWIIDACNSPPHGAVFKKWGARFEQQYDDIEVTTLHSYEIAYKYHYQCTNPACGKVYGRHSKSIDTTKQVCGVCKSRLSLMERASKDGTPKAPSKFALFVKENFKTTKDGNVGASHAEVMRLLSESYRALSVDSAETQCKDTEKSHVNGGTDGDTVHCDP